jgi:hypothetical protein
MASPNLTAVLAGRKAALAEHRERQAGRGGRVGRWHVGEGGRRWAVVPLWVKRPCRRCGRVRYIYPRLGRRIAWRGSGGGWQVRTKLIPITDTRSRVEPTTPRPQV